MNLTGLRHVILDRDGVLNREAQGADYVREPCAVSAGFPGALEALAMLRRAGLRLTVATNQAGVGRGLMSLEQLAAVHARMQADAARTAAHSMRCWSVRTRRRRTACVASPHPG